MELKDIKKVMRVTYNKWLLNGYTNGMSYLLKIKTNFETAAWTTEVKNGTKVNIIIIGDKAMEMSNEIGNKKRMLENLLYHEFGHSKFTTDRFEVIDKELKKIYAKFELFNLFEDFRMENKVRELTSYRFNWFDYINPDFMGVGHHQPESLLLALKNAEHLLSEENVELVKNAYIKAYIENNTEKSELEAEEIFDKVLKYFAPKILEAQTALHLIPVMKEWLDEFYDEDELKREQEQQERLQEMAQKIAEAMKEAGLEGTCVPGSGLEMPMPSNDKDNEEESSESENQEGGDLQAAKKAEEKQSQGRETNQEINKNSEEVAGDAMEKLQSDSEKGKMCKGKKEDEIEQDSVIIEEFTTEDILRYCRGYGEDVDIKKAKKLLPAFEKFLKSNAVSQAVSRPSKRISTRNIMLDREKIYKRKVETSKNQKTISLVLDCSGSMSYVMPEMKIVIWIINNLARQHKIEGNIILSAWEGYQTFKMPMKDEDLNAISGYSRSEGIAHTFEATKSFLKKSDYVFCLTDGNINDQAIDKKSLARQGVRPIGIYIGDKAVNLKKWFDRYVNRQNAKTTIDEIVRKIK